MPHIHDRLDNLLRLTVRPGSLDPRESLFDLILPAQIEEVARPLLDDPSVHFSTLIYKIRREEEVGHPNAVKVAFDRDHFALYF